MGAIAPTPVKNHQPTLIRPVFPKRGDL